MKASDRQVSGSHYKSYAIQPAEFIQRNNLNWCEGNAIKYLVRHRDKKGAEDIRKAIHYLELLLEWEYPQEGAAASIADVKRDMGEGFRLDPNHPLASAKHKRDVGESLCTSCQRNVPFKCHGEYPATSDGGCEGYIKAERKASLCHSCDIGACAADNVRKCEDTGQCPYYVSALRENMLDAKQEVTTTRISFPKDVAMTYTSVGRSHPEDCVNTDCCSYTQVLARNCSRYPMSFIKMCGLYKTAIAKQEPPTSAVLPLDFTLPSIALKCTAGEAWKKYESELLEWADTEDNSTEELVERWDCIHALRTYYERGGDVKEYQHGARVIMEEISKWYAEGRDVLGAKAACLLKNAKRGYYSPEVNAAIIASKGHRFQPLDEMGVI